MLTSTYQTPMSFPIHASTRTGGGFVREPQSVERVAYIITEDKRLAADLMTLVRSNRARAEWFTSSHRFLEHHRSDAASCILISRAPEPSLAEQLQHSVGVSLPPMILLSDAGDIPSCVRAIRAGAHDFLTLPLMAPHLLEAIRTAFEKDEEVIALRRENDSLRRRWKSLTSREAEVMRYVVDGFLNKQTAAELSITENTVQVHRGRVMRKMGADSFAALVRMSLKLAEWGEYSMLCGARPSIWGHGTTLHENSIV